MKKIKKFLKSIKRFLKSTPITKPEQIFGYQPCKCKHHPDVGGPF